MSKNQLRITDLLKSDSIELNVQIKTKEEAIEHLVELMNKGGHLKDKDQYLKDVLAREEAGSTFLGNGIATPHAKSLGVENAGLAAMTISEGVTFEAGEDKAARLIFAIAAPNNDNDEHLQILAKVARMLMDSNLKDALVNAKTNEEFLKLIDNYETDKAVIANGTDKDNPAFILAVTACPTGIAHTFMAAESLKQHASKRNINIKVETNGAGGAENVLTAEEIANADAIIVAADKNVEMERFNGKRVVITKVADALNKADELFDRALSNTTPIYKQEQQKQAEKILPTSSENVATESLGRKTYKHLMNGVSHMLPFVVGGGILIAIAFLIDSMAIDISNLTPEQREKFGTITPAADFFKNIGGISFEFMLPILAGFIAMSIADRPGLAPGFVGGMLCLNSKAGFLGALVAGFLAGFTIKWLKKNLEFLPASLNGVKNILLYPLLSILIVGFICIFIIAPPVSAINEWLIDSLKSMNTSAQVLIGALFGGMMAIDMGGPINKAAYVTGTALLLNGEYHIMAAVMAGGMVPPLAISLATIFFKKKFTESERKTTSANIVMGLSFITEGAIPFAAADPFRVIPACVIGSAVAGALVMAFNCTLMAPHGGIFVVPTISAPFMYIIAILVGSLIGAFALGILKKNLQ